MAVIGRWEFAIASLAGGERDSAARATTGGDKTVEVIDHEVMDVEVIDGRIME